MGFLSAMGQRQSQQEHLHLLPLEKNKKKLGLNAVVVGDLNGGKREVVVR